MTEPEGQIPTALIQVRPGADLRVTALYAEVMSLFQYAHDLVVASDGDVKRATEDLVLMSGLKKALEEKRQEYVGPINAHLKDINAAFKGFAFPLEQADSITRGKILAYRAEQEAIRLEQERINRLREEAAQAEMKLKGELTEPVGLIPVQPAPPGHYRTEAGNLSSTKVWKFEVEDFRLLPDNYKEANLVKIRKVITAGVAIPGVRSWQEEALRVTTKEG